jgi:yeast amino acid transporter
MEKEPDYAVDPNVDHPSNSEEASKIEARRGSKVNEASDLYGDVQTAEEYGYVSRG